MEGKLLQYVESFCWKNKAEDRSLALQNYNKALDKAREVGDNVYCPETMYNTENLDNVFQFMYFNGYMSFEILKGHFSWLMEPDFQILLQLSYMMGSPTPNSSNDWTSFSAEFPDYACSLIGMEDSTCTHPLVYDEDSHAQFHGDYVSSFDFEKQKLSFKIFKKYYKPKLKKEAAQINRAIDRNQVNEGILRLDPPKKDPKGMAIHGQQVHVHLKIGSKEYALNIDGTWKHAPTANSKDRISAEICETLSDWGFILPDDYYT
ncbi:hypothetical protein [Chryseobacterium sp. 22543]|uniref:hypothetical protein n=1 Tax=Chryseobacterium sp. 22543 TaxID=3453940 RepID=UPI003F8503C3